MLTKLAHSIIKYRLFLLIVLGVFTAFMAYKAKDVEMNYSFIKAVPDDDQEMQYYQNFKNTFGEDGDIIIIGFNSPEVYNELSNFNLLVEYTEKIKKLDGVEVVLSIPNLVYLDKNKETKSFDAKPIFYQKPTHQKELDSLIQVIKNQKFYENQLVNYKTGASLMAVTISKETSDSKKKDALVESLIDLGNELQDKTGVKIHYAGLPYLRSWKAQKVSEELRIFLILSLVVTALVLLFFFRSFYAVIVPMIIIGVMVIWSMGTLVLLGYKMSILTGLIPPIIVVIGIPNSVYLLNKYHQEFRKHGNKIKALSLIIRKIGAVTFITNLTTAIGFLVFVTTSVDILKEFGIVAGVNIFNVFVSSIILIPAIFSYLPEPKSNHLKHLDFKFFKKLLLFIDNIVINHRKAVYLVTAVVVVISLYGISLVKSVSFMVDGLPEKSVVRQDLAFFEKNFNGVMPFEILVDTKKPKGVMNLSTLKKINELESILVQNQYISAPISVVSFTKLFTQAFYKNNPQFYKLPNNQEKNFVVSYLKTDNENFKINNKFTDSTGQIARISMRIADIGSQKLDTLVQTVINPAIDSVFSKTDFEVYPTGTTLIFLKGNKFIINSLSQSLLIAFVLIAIIMALLFGSFRMILISMVPNMIPLLITGAIMGYFNFPLNPSTALIFSIAFGISVDDSIHYLAKYRQELFSNNFNVPKAVSISILETGTSMIYTSIILFFGFIIFVFSDFGGTISLGLLTSITLLFALITNLTFLPSLILSFDDGKRKKRSKNSLILVDQFDDFEEEISSEVNLDLLKVKVKGEVYAPIYDAEIEEHKNKIK